MSWKVGHRKGQTLLARKEHVPKPQRRVLTVEERKFNAERRQLRMMYKSIKAGLVDPAFLTQEQKVLLERYYGYDAEASPMTRHEGKTYGKEKEGKEEVIFRGARPRRKG